MSGVRCPKCGNTDEATIWEDNFWSGCNRCGWTASCEAMPVLVPKEFDYSAWRKHYGYDTPDEE